MTDLCYNCGDCHLPSPCAVALTQCTICKNYGHTYNFCPLGVKIVDPNYQYWALCHNCDKWHLPEACKVLLHRCTQCQQGGHLEVFCPFKPVSRRLKDNAQNFQVGAKRQRTNSSGGSDAQITAELAHKIKMETAHQFTDLLNKGLHQDHILRMFAMTSATYGPRNGIAAHNGSVPNTPTTAPATAHTMKNEGTPGLYSIQHDRFNGGDLVHTQTQGLVRQYASPYSDNFQAPGGDTKPPDDNINVGAASVLQNMAQSAATEAVTAAGNYGSLITTAGSNMAMPATSGPNVHDTLLNDLSATYPQLQAQANTAPDAGFPAVNSGIAENMPLYQSHVLPSQGPSESIAVGATEAEEAPPLALRKDGKPRKKQPKRVQPPRNKT